MSATDRSYYDDDNEKRMERSMRDADKQLAALELSQPMPCILQQFSTADLVAELCSREGVEEMEIGKSRIYSICVSHECSVASDEEYNCCNNGPAKIIVVRGEE